MLCACPHVVKLARRLNLPLCSSKQTAVPPVAAIWCLSPYNCTANSLLGVLQAFAGIVTVSVGHCHPKVVQAVDRQNHLLQHTTNIYLNNEIAEYAQELTAKLPGKLNVTLLRSHQLHVVTSCMRSLGL